MSTLRSATPNDNAGTRQHSARFEMRVDPAWLDLLDRVRGDQSRADFIRDTVMRAARRRKRK